MDAADRRLRLLGRLAWLTLALLVAVTVLSAYLRHRAAGLGCQPWPACFGQGEPAAAGALVVRGQALTIARAAHRISATAALLLVIAMLVLSTARRPRLRRQASLSLALLVLALPLAVLGVVTPGSRWPAVAVGNLAGGFAMLALAARLAAAPRHGGLGAWAIGAALLLLAHAALGAATSASFAGLACSDLLECFEQARAGGWDWAALDPRREPPLTVATPSAEGALMQLLHRAASLVVAPLLAAFAALAWRRGRRREAFALLLLLALQIALGLIVGNGGLPLLPVLLHNLATAAMLALLLRLA